MIEKLQFIADFIPTWCHMALLESFNIILLLLVLAKNKTHLLNCRVITHITYKKACKETYKLTIQLASCNLPSLGRMNGAICCHRNVCTGTGTPRSCSPSSIGFVVSLAAAIPSWMANYRHKATVSNGRSYSSSRSSCRLVGGKLDGVDLETE